MDFHKGRATDAVLESSLPSMQRLLMIVYIKHADQHGIAWPGGERLAKLCGSSLKSVKRHRAALIACGVLDLVEGGAGKVYRIRINLEALPTGDTESPGSDCHRGQNVPSGGVRMSPVVGSNCPPNIHSEDHTNEDHTNPHKSPTGDEPEDEPEEKIDKVAICFEKLCEMRSRYVGSRARALKLTANRRRQLGSRMKEYSEEEILHAWRWWHTSTSEMAITLRQGYDLDTFIRPSRHDNYQTHAQKEAEALQDAPESTRSDPLSPEDQERIRIEWEAAQAEKERQLWADKDRAEAQIREMVGGSQRPELTVIENTERASCSWDEYQRSMK
tara:strand:+ start:372 stop:1361 length:990 start_codon:yes stop_codon:yes gene_type:complete